MTDTEKIKGQRKVSNSEIRINKTQSFVLEVKSQENHSWQGTIAWVEGKKKENFRSTLELIRLMDSILANESEESSE